MNDVVIEAENLSKVYRLGTIGTGSLRQDIKSWWLTSILKKSDPFFSTLDARNNNGNSQYIWALKDLNFQMRKGEVWGLVGKNGAGKSTLLKIISKIINPTAGIIRGKGKISSLLELGTGFHRELTGRENVYLSGYTLGMTKNEVKEKFDEIIEFSGISAFIDTPVKRYSSGMYVRLAFSVAAHLEPDILIVDEVLAVGDAEFQAKSLQKMQDFASNKERAIIFVSHNLHSVNALCSHALWLQQGQLIEAGEAKVITDKYLNGAHQNHLRQLWADEKTAPGTDQIKVRSVELSPQHGNVSDIIDTTTPLNIKLAWYNLSKQTFRLSIQLFNRGGQCILDIPTAKQQYETGTYEATCSIPGNFLVAGSYSIAIDWISEAGSLFYFRKCIEFDISENAGVIIGKGKAMGFIRPDFPVVINQVKETFF